MDRGLFGATIEEGNCSSREGGESIHRERGERSFIERESRLSREDAVHQAREVTVCREGRDRSSGGKRLFAKERRLFVQRGIRRVREGAIRQARDIK